MRIAQGLVLAMGIYMALLNSENVIEGRSAHIGYIAIGTFILNYKATDIETAIWRIDYYFFFFSIKLFLLCL